MRSRWLLVILNLSKNKCTFARKANLKGRQLVSLSQRQDQNLELRTHNFCVFKQEKRHTLSVFLATNFNAIKVIKGNHNSQTSIHSVRVAIYNCNPPPLSLSSSSTSLLLSHTVTRLGATPSYLLDHFQVKLPW